MADGEMSEISYHRYIKPARLLAAIAVVSLSSRAANKVSPYAHNIRRDARRRNDALFDAHFIFLVINFAGA